MATMSNSCFICAKPSVVFYDFLAVERYSETVSKGAAARQTTTREMIRGIARITQCKECMKESLIRLISEKTKKNGAPMMFEKKKVEELRRFNEEIDRGIYDRTRDKRTSIDQLADGLARIFVASFDMSGLTCQFTLQEADTHFGLKYIPIENQTLEVRKLFKDSEYIPFSRLPDNLKTPLMKRLMNTHIDPQYVLWTPRQGNQPPFSCAIAPEFDGWIKMKCMSFNQDGNIFDDSKSDVTVPEIKKQLPAIYDIYKSCLINV